MGVENIAGSTSNLFANCSPAIRSSIDTTGIMTMTNVQRPLPSELDSIFTSGSANYYWRNMQDLFTWRLSVMPVTYHQYGMFDFLADMAVDVSSKLAVPEAKDGRLEIAPFIYARREEPINTDAWAATSGYRSDVDGSANAAGSYWTVSVTSPTGIPIDAGSDESHWFNVGERVFATAVTAGGTVAETAWTVAAFLSTGDKLVLSPAMPTSGTGFGRGVFDWGAANALLAPPVTGMLYRGVPNKSPYESWCEQPPGLISNQFDPFWFESTQESFVATESWRKLQSMLVSSNQLFAEMYNLPEAKYRQQTSMDFKRRMAHQMMYGTPSNANQTLALYRSLNKVAFYYPATLPPSTATPATTESEYISYRADCVGIQEQHAARGRVVNAQGTPFNIPAFEQALYELTRYRNDIGMPNSKIVELMMPKKLYPSFLSAMLQRYKYQSQDMLQMFLDVNKAQNTAPLGFAYKEFPLIYPPDVTLRVVFHDWFDDELARYTAAGIPAAGRQIWVLPWKYNRMGVVNSVRTVREVGDIELQAKINPAYQCQILGRKKFIELTNITYTVICSAPMAGLIFKGVGDTVEGLNVGTVAYPGAGSCALIP